MPPSNAMQRLKALLKGKGLATSGMTVARALFNLVASADAGESLDATRITRREFAMLLLRSRTRLPGREVELVFQELAQGSDTLNLAAAVARAERPREDRKLRSPDAIIEALKRKLIGSRHHTASIYRHFIKAATPGSKQLTRAQLATALRNFGLVFTPASLMKLFNQLDRNRSATVDFAQFLVATIGVPSKHIFDVSRTVSRPGTSAQPSKTGAVSRPTTAAARQGGRLGRDIAQLKSTLRDRLNNSALHGATGGGGGGSSLGGGRASLLETFREFLNRAGSNSKTISRRQFGVVVESFGLAGADDSVTEGAFESLDRQGCGEIDFSDFQAGLFEKQATSPGPVVDHFVNMGARRAKQKARFAEAQAILETQTELHKALTHKLNSAVGGLAASFKHFLVKVRLRWHMLYVLHIATLGRPVDRPLIFCGAPSLRQALRFPAFVTCSVCEIVSGSVRPTRVLQIVYQCPSGIRAQLLRDRWPQSFPCCRHERRWRG
eukprot:INCI18856.1.p1 GENE.INCI18856.1~~INCI18856.1.p1  ORF type:complete len:495 (-),score=61.88 INCI18856.1:4016-5500(-)